MLSILLSISVFSFCQSTDPSLKKLKNQTPALKELYPENKVLNYYSYNRYYFSLNKSTKLINVRQVLVDQYVGLIDNSEVFSYKFYDSYSSKLSDFSLKQSSSDINFYKKCGDYEIEGIFFHDNKSCIYKLEFPESGDNARMQTEIKTNDSRYFTTVYLNENNYILRGELKFIIPNNVDIEIIEYNIDTSHVKRKETTILDTRTISYNFKDFEPANYENIAGPSWVFPHLLILTKGYWEDGRYHNLFNNYQNLYSWLTNLLVDYSEKQNITEITKSLELDNKSDKEKLELVLEWVQNNIRYTAFEDGIAGFKPKSTDQVLNTHYADCKGMSNLLYFLLKDIGFDARRCWVGTDRLVYNEKKPSLSIDNHMICAVKTDTGFVYLDATDKYSILGETIEYLQGQIVAIENGENTILDTIPLKPYSSNQIFSTADVIQDSGLLKIKRNVNYKGSNRKEIQGLVTEVFGSEKDKFIKMIFKATNSKLQIDSVSIIDKRNSYNIYLEMIGKNMIFSQAGKLFLPLDYEYGPKLKAIDTTRKIHYSLGLRTQKKYTTILHLKKNQSLISLPENTNIEYPGFACSFYWELKNDTIIYSKTLDIKDKIIEPNDFKQWNEFVKKYNKLSSELIILSENL